MNVLMLQTDMEWLAPAVNRANAARMIGGLCAGGAKPDLIVLPEMFTTGFCTSPAGVAEPAGTETLAWMRETAAANDAAVAGSVVTEDGGKYYNRFYFVKPDGNYVTYDKRHLFTYGGEHKEFTAGSGRVVAEHAGFRILLQICYDLRFPVFARNRGDYDMIIYVASWPVARVEAWNALLKARAIENVCYVAGVNRVGRDAMGEYDGSSVLLDFKGQAVAAAALGKEEAFCGTADLRVLRDFRAKFPALDDADDFTISGL